MLARLQTLSDRQPISSGLAVVGKTLASHLVASFGTSVYGFRGFRLPGVAALLGAITIIESPIRSS